MKSLYRGGVMSSSFVAWTLAVRAIANALFGSLPAAELQYRLSLRDTPRRQRIARFNWEINNRAKWNEDVAHGSPHGAAVPLPNDEVEARRRELQQLTRNSLAWRAFIYFMGCFACQTFWTAIVIYAITRSASDLRGWFFSSAAYSGAAMFLPLLYGSGQTETHVPDGRKPACTNRGK